MKSGTRSIVIALVVIAVIAVAAYVLLRPRSPQAAADAGDTAPAIATTVARAGAVARDLSETGRVGSPAGAQTKLVFAVPGVIGTIDVHVGQPISAGQAIASLDASSYQLAATQAQADAQAARAAYAAGRVPASQVRGAQAKVAAADERIAVDERTLERARLLAHAGVAAQKDVEAVQAQIAADRADRLQAQSDLRAAQTQPAVVSAQVASASARAGVAARDLARATLYSPISGVVDAVYKHVGEAADASNPVVAIGPAGQDQATLDVPAADAAQVTVGDTVVLHVNGVDQAVSGRVVGVVPSIDPATQSTTVVVSGVPASAVAGSAVRATIAVGSARGVLVPSTAIVQDPQSGDTLVFVKSRDKNGDTKFTQRTVHVAFDDGKNAVIESGLRAGETVASQGAFALLAPAGGGG